MTVVVVRGLRLVTVVMLVMVVMTVIGVKAFFAERNSTFAAPFGVGFFGGCVVDVVLRAARTSGCQGGKKREVFFFFWENWEEESGVGFGGGCG